MSDLKPIMSIESILEYGFKEWKIDDYDKHDRHWQYCVKDKIGKKFFVQIRLWNFSKYSNKEREVFDSFDAYVQFDLNGAKTFNVDLSVNNMSPDQVIDWFDGLFLKLSCSYYELFDSYEYNLDKNCTKCNKFLTDGSTLCPDCSYEQETGFKKFVPKRKRKK